MFGANVNGYKKPIYHLDLENAVHLGKLLVIDFLLVGINTNRMFPATSGIFGPTTTTIPFVAID